MACDQTGLPSETTHPAISTGAGHRGATSAARHWRRPLRRNSFLFQEEGRRGQARSSQGGLALWRDVHGSSLVVPSLEDGRTYSATASFGPIESGPIEGWKPHGHATRASRTGALPETAGALASMAWRSRRRRPGRDRAAARRPGGCARCRALRSRRPGAPRNSGDGHLSVLRLEPAYRWCARSAS